MNFKQNFIVIEEREGLPPVEPEGRKTKIFMTQYEKAALIIQRANQLMSGADPLVPYEKFDAISIARREVEARVLKNLAVRRTLPDGTFEDINSTELIIL